MIFSDHFETAPLYVQSNYYDTGQLKPLNISLSIETLVYLYTENTKTESRKIRGSGKPKV